MSTARSVPAVRRHGEKTEQFLQVTLSLYPTIVRPGPPLSSPCGSQLMVNRPSEGTDTRTVRHVSSESKPQFVSPGTIVTTVDSPAVRRLIRYRRTFIDAVWLTASGNKKPT